MQTLVLHTTCRACSESPSMALLHPAKVSHIDTSFRLNECSIAVLVLGTTAKLLAKKLGFGYIDSGAMYRAVSIPFAMSQYFIVD